MKKSPLVLTISAANLVAFTLTEPALAQASSPGPAPPASITHEILLVLAGAVFGGFLGPILQAVDFWLGITPGAKQQRDNYEVQREIASSLRKLANAESAIDPIKEPSETAG